MGWGPIIHCCSAIMWCLTLLLPNIGCSMPGSSVLSYLLEFAQRGPLIGPDLNLIISLKALSLNIVTLAVTVSTYELWDPIQSITVNTTGPGVFYLVQFSSVAQLVSDSLRPWNTARQASLSITNSWSLPKPMSVESVMPSNHLILCLPLLLLPPIPPSIRVFSSESALRIRWPKYWSFSFNISPSNEHPGLVSFRMDWLDLLAVQGTLKSLLQHHSSKASILRCLAFFIVQLSHPYMTTGKSIALTRWAFVGKVMFLLFNILSRFVIAFLPRSKHLLISWLQSPSAVILEPKKIVCHSFHCFPIYLPWSDGTRCRNSFLNVEF